MVETAAHVDMTKRRPRTSREPGLRSIFIFIVVALALLMSSIDSTIVAVGLPAMVEGLKTNLVWLGWVLTAYQLSQTVVMPMAGKLSDELGRKWLFLGCVFLFTLSSLLCALAPNVYWLILFRVFQAMGGGAFLPSASGIVSDVFDDRWRPTAIGLFTSVFPLGGIIGPNVGGWMIDHFGWRSIFFVNVPIGVVLLLAGLVLIPRGVRAPRQHRIDFLGAGLFALGIVGIMYGMTVWGNQVVFSWQVALWIVLGILALVAFVYQESRVPDPMVELRLLRECAFVAVNVYNFLYGALVFGFFSFIPLYAIDVYHMSETTAGFILTPRAVIMVLCSTISSFVLIRTGYRVPMIVGILFVSLGLFLTSQGWQHVTLFGHPVSDVVLLSALVGITGIGVGIGGPASNNAAVELMPETVARIIGLRGMFRSTGGVLGTATIVLLLAHFRDQGHGLEVILRGLSALILLVIPIIFLIPDTARARWQKQQQHLARVREAGD
jgi:EmrB/QacA subfamily drug resistance transporter